MIVHNKLVLFGIMKVLTYLILKKVMDLLLVRCFGLKTLKQEKLLMGFSQDTKEHLNEIKDWALKAGRFEKDFNLDDFVDTTLLENGGFM